MNNDFIKEVTGREREDMEITGSFEGIPYRGEPVYLKKTDDPAAVLQLNRVLSVKRFDLADDKQLKEYEKVCQAIQDGHAQLSFEKMEYKPDDKNWVVLVRWIDWWYSPITKDKK